MLCALKYISHQSGAWNLSFLTTGPHVFLTNYRADWEWSSTQRFVHPERRGLPPDFPGSYNNLDYMFSFNLFYMKYIDLYR